MPASAGWAGSDVAAPVLPVLAVVQSSLPGGPAAGLAGVCASSRSPGTGTWRPHSYRLLVEVLTTLNAEAARKVAEKHGRKK